MARLYFATHTAAGASLILEVPISWHGYIANVANEPVFLDDQYLSATRAAPKHELSGEGTRGMGNDTLKRSRHRRPRLGLGAESG
jgi:hypothetical protein